MSATCSGLPCTRRHWSGAGYGVLFAQAAGYAFAAWLPDDVEGLRGSLFYAACYFAAKAALVAYVSGVVQPQRPAPARRRLGRVRADAQAETASDREEKQRAARGRSALGLDDLREDEAGRPQGCARRAHYSSARNCTPQMRGSLT